VYTFVLVVLVAIIETTAHAVYTLFVVLSVVAAAAELKRAQSLQRGPGSRPHAGDIGRALHTVGQDPAVALLHGRGEERKLHLRVLGPWHQILLQKVIHRHVMCLFVLQVTSNMATHGLCGMSQKAHPTCHGAP